MLFRSIILFKVFLMVVVTTATNANVGIAIPNTSHKNCPKIFFLLFPSATIIIFIDINSRHFTVLLFFFYGFIII